VFTAQAGGATWNLNPTTGDWNTAANWTPAALYGGTFQFERAGNLQIARVYHTATLLQNGQVLVVGGETYRGITASAELYDPATGIWTKTGNLHEGREHQTATLLQNGQVLVVGGVNAQFQYIASAELYDPATGRWRRTGSLTTLRIGYTPTLLPNGKVLVAGGSFDTYFASAELYDPAIGTWTPTASMAAKRADHTATLLSDGKVLVAGGFDSAYLASAELYSPDTPVAAPALVSVSGDGQGQGAIFHAGTRQLATSDDPALVGDSVDIYCTGLSTGGVLPPQVAIGGRMAALLAVGAVPVAPGVTQVRVRIPTGITPGPAVRVRLTYLDRPSNEVTIGVR